MNFIKSILGLAVLIVMIIFPWYLIGAFIGWSWGMGDWSAWLRLFFAIAVSATAMVTLAFIVQQD